MEIDNEFLKSSEIDLLNSKSLVEHTVKMSLIGSKGTVDWPQITITHNKKQLWAGEVTDQQLDLEFNITHLCKRNMINIVMHNKTLNDTVLDDSGNLLIDKSISLEKLEIGRVKLRPVEDFIRFYPNYPDHIVDQPRSLHARYLGFNGTLKIYYTNAPADYYVNKNGLFDTSEIVTERVKNYFKIAEMMRSHG